MKKDYILKKTISKNLMFCSIILLLSYSLKAQNLNFTIDTAIDNGNGSDGNITQTLTFGSDTYTLLIDVPGSGAETIVPLFGTDLVFYLGSSTTINTFNLSLTKNGNPTNFRLNGIDYDTLEDGFISIVNQDDAEISANQEYVVGAGAINITNPTNAADITGFKILQPDFSDNTDFAFHNIDVDILNTLSTDEFTSIDSVISVYPNPSNGTIIIKNSGAALTKVNVKDNNGRIITSQDLNGISTEIKLDLSSKLCAGLYFMTISTENTSTVKKIIIE